MLDLRTDAVTDWLLLAQPASIDCSWPPPVRPIETTTRAEALLIELGELLEREAQEDPAAFAAQIGHPEIALELQAICAQLGAARPLRILHWLNERGVPEHYAVIRTLLAGDSPSARALRATIAAITRRATLNRLFSSDRLAELQTAVEAALKETA